MFLSVRKLGQWGEKVTCIFNVAAKSIKWIQCILEDILNLRSRRWLNPSRNLVKYFLPFTLWQPNILFAAGLINFKILRLGSFWISGSSLFHSIMTDGKKVFLKKLCLTLKWGILFVFLVEYGLINLGIIWKRYFGDCSLKINKSCKVFWTNACVAETPSLALQKFSL